MEQLEVKASVSIEEDGTLSVLAWPFSSADSVGDVIEAKAAITVDNPLPIYWHHDASNPIGTWDRVEITARGIEAKGRLNLDNERARAVRTLIRDNGASGVSIGFNDTKSTPRLPRGRIIHGFSLREISVTPTPCHPGARVLTAKTKGVPMEQEMTAAAPDAAATLDFTAALAAMEKKAMDRLDKIEARMNRPVTSAASSADDEIAIETKALREFYRSGSADELKALTTTTGTSGVMAPPQLSTTILEKITLVSPVRQLATSIGMSAGSVAIPRLVEEVTVGEVAETTPDPRPSSNPTFEEIDLKAFEMAHFVPVSRQALEDANIDLNSYLQQHLVRKFGETESRWFVIGNGTTQPEGVMKSAEVGEMEAAAVNLDALIDLYHSIKAPYANAGAWLMNSKTIAAIRKMKDGDGRPLWEPSLQIGQPATLFGRPVYAAPDMADAESGNAPIIFGDFATAYLIADRIAFEPLREDLARSPFIHIGGRRRVGGRVVMGEALTKLVLA